MLIVALPNRKNRCGRTGLPHSEVLKIANGKIVARYRYTFTTFDIAKLVEFLNSPAYPRPNIETLPDYML